MERWAANTLRTLGIILTAGFVLVVSGFLALLSMCAAGPSYGGGPGNKEEAAYFAIAAALVALGGMFLIAYLARAIIRSNRQPLPVPADVGALAAPPEPSHPFHLSPLGRKAVDRLVFALGAQIVVSGGIWIFNQIRYWSKARVFAPFPSTHWSVVLAPFILYHLPYAILIYNLLKRPDRRAFTFSLAVPAVLIMQSLLSLGVISFYLQNQPFGFLLMVIPWAIHIVIIVYAYQAIQQVGLHPHPSSLIVAAIVSFVFFSFVHSVTPFLYRWHW